jgi:small subunit ribosomal protein S18
MAETRGGRPIAASQRPTGDINYKDVKTLNNFVSERGKITPRRISGVCTPHQKRLSEAIKQARNIALLPFAAQL